MVATPLAFVANILPPRLLTISLNKSCAALISVIRVPHLQRAHVRPPDAIADAVSAAVAGQSRDVLWITGEPGIGKTRLLEEVSSQVLTRGGRALSGRAYEAEMVRPYGPWIDALRSAAGSLTDDSLTADLAPLLPELGKDAPRGDRNSRFSLCASRIPGA